MAGSYQSFTLEQVSQISIDELCKLLFFPLDEENYLSQFSTDDKNEITKVIEMWNAGNIRKAKQHLEKIPAKESDIRLLCDLALCNLIENNWHAVKMLVDKGRSLKLSLIQASHISLIEAIYFLNNNNTQKALEITIQTHESESNILVSIQLLKRILDEIFEEDIKREQITALNDITFDTLIEMLYQIEEMTQETQSDLHTKRKLFLSIWKTFVNMGNLLHKIPFLGEEVGLKTFYFAMVYDMLGSVWRDLHEYLLAAGSYFISTAMVPTQYDSLQRLGYIQFCRGKFTQSEVNINKALNLCKKIEDENEKNKRMAENLTTRGLLYANTNRNDLAIKDLEKAIQLAKMVNSLNDLGLALANLGITFRGIGQYLKAIRCHTEALDIAKRAKNTRNTSDNLHHLARCYLAMKNREKALEFAEKAYEAYPTIYTKMHHHGLRSVILLYSEFDKEVLDVFKLNEARKLLEEAISIANSLKEITTEKEYQGDLANVLVLVGDLKGAKKVLMDAINELETISDFSLVGIMYMMHALTLFRISNIEQSVSHLLLAEEAFKKVWFGLNRDEFMITWGQTFLNLFKALQTCYIIQNNTNAALEATDRGRARSLLEIKQRALKVSLPELNIDDIRKLATNLKINFVYFSEKHNQMLCWIICPDCSEVKFLTFPYNNSQSSSNAGGRLTDYKLLAMGWEQITVRSFIITTESSNFQNKEIFKELFKDIIGHLKYSTTNKIILFPDGDLWSIPFSVLEIEPNYLLIEKFSFSLAPSLSILRTNLQKFQSEFHKVLLVSNPEFSHKQGNQALDFPELPYSNKECEGVAEFLRQCNSNNQITILNNAQASKRNVLDYIQNCTIIHFATHALSETDNSLDCISPGFILLSNISNTVDDNEYLSSEEIQCLDLSRVHLAFLNCCQTGKGKTMTEGLLGLGRAFLLAGVSEVVLSLRNVQDSEITCEFVLSFYEQYFKTGEVDTALCASQLEFYKKGVPETLWSSYYNLRQ